MSRFFDRNFFPVDGDDFDDTDSKYEQILPDQTKSKFYLSNFEKIEHLQEELIRARYILEKRRESLAALEQQLKGLSELGFWHRVSAVIGAPQLSANIATCQHNIQQNELGITELEKEIRKFTPYYYQLSG